MTHSFNFEKDSLMIFDLVSYINQIAESLKRWTVLNVGRIGAGIIFLFAWFFLAGVFWVLYRYLISTRSNIEVNFDNYGSFKKQQLILNEKLKNTPILDLGKIQKLNWFMRLPVYYMALSQNVLLDYKKELDQKLGKLDEMSSHNSHFEQRGEDQLWQSRNKVYPYLM
jgi:hypothetical protein